MSFGFAEGVDIGSKIATIGAFVFTGVTFFVLFYRRRKSEQYTIASEISNSLAELENKILEVPKDDEKEKKYRRMQYLNVWEWFAVLVNHGEIKNKTIQDHFRPNQIEDHDTFFEKYPEWKNDDDMFPEFKRLYKKWKDR